MKPGIYFLIMTILGKFRQRSCPFFNEMALFGSVSSQLGILLYTFVLIKLKFTSNIDRDE